MNDTGTIALFLLAAGLAAGGCVGKSAIPVPGGSPDDDVADDDTGGDDDTSGDDDVTADDDSDCGFAEITPDPDGALFGPVSLATDLQPLIDGGCDCHQVGNPSIEDLSPGRVWGAWVEQPSTDDPDQVLVLPAHPEESVVFWKLMGCYPLFPYSGAPMPPNAPRLTLGELGLFYNWVLQGGLDN